MPRLMRGLKLMVVVLVEEEEEEETQLLWLQGALNCRRLPRLTRAAKEEKTGMTRAMWAVATNVAGWNVLLIGI